MIGGIGMTELIIVLVIVVIIFGATRLPQLGKGIGEAIRNFKKATNEPSEIDITPKKKSGENVGSEEKIESSQEKKT